MELLSEVLQGREQGDQQHAQHQGGQVGLDAEPDDGDAAADQGRDLGAVDAEADAAHHREGDAGLDAHEAGKAQQDEEQHGADAEGQQDLPAAKAQREQADGEGVVAQAVHVVGPQGEDVVAGPAAARHLGGGEVLVVQAGAEGVALADRRAGFCPQDGPGGWGPSRRCQVCCLTRPGSSSPWGLHWIPGRTSAVERSGLDPH